MMTYCARSARRTGNSDDLGPPLLLRAVPGLTYQGNLRYSGAREEAIIEGAARHEDELLNASISLSGEGVWLKGP